MDKTLTTYKQLPKEDEIELVLWLGFLDDSIGSALVQKRRWKRYHNFWDIQMYFIALINAEDAMVGLKKFLSYHDREFWGVLKSFRNSTDKIKLGDLRNDLLHREKIFKLQDKKGQPLPNKSVLVLGGYNFSNDEYMFGTHVIKVNDTFLLVQNCVKNIRKLFKDRLIKYYESGKYEAIIPWTNIRSLSEIGKLRESITNRLARHEIR